MNSILFLSKQTFTEVSNLVFFSYFPDDYSPIPRIVLGEFALQRKKLAVQQDSVIYCSRSEFCRFWHRIEILAVNGFILPENRMGSLDKSRFGSNPVILCIEE